ncbi:hypothetical protein Q7P35_009784 [Cladosporium inversicolor]
MGFRYCGGAKVLRIRNSDLVGAIFVVLSNAQFAPRHPEVDHPCKTAPVASVQRRHRHDSLRMFKKRREDIIAAILLAAWPRATRQPAPETFLADGDNDFSGLRQRELGDDLKPQHEPKTRVRIAAPSRPAIGPSALWENHTDSQERCSTAASRPRATVTHWPSIMRSQYLTSVANVLCLAPVLLLRPS